jgi:DNA-directed RNA polymerase subunit RPC12/RpoP
MYECYECGERFETPADGELIGDGSEYTKVCPECGSDDIVEVDDYDELDPEDE